MSIEDRAAALGVQLYETRRAPKNPQNLGWWWRPTPWRGVKHNRGPFVTAEAALADAERREVSSRDA